VAATESGGPDAAGVTWLCRPGLAGDPCLYPEGATSVAADGAKTAVPAASPSPSASEFDCFYVYPTVTASAATDNTGTAVTPALEGAAVEQASRFSHVCNVWAPTYPQRTSASLSKGFGNDPAADAVSYQSLLEGWKDYLVHDNHGRPVVFIGHSQGAANLIRLLRSEVDGNATLRDRMVSAIILGGNVQVPTGKTVGGTFAHIPTCTRTSETGCVIGYSSYSSPAAHRLPLRTAWRGREPPVWSGGDAWPTGRLHQSFRPRRDRSGVSDALFRLVGHLDGRTLGDLSRSLYGYV